MIAIIFEQFVHLLKKSRRTAGYAAGLQPFFFRLFMLPYASFFSSAGFSKAASSGCSLFSFV